MDSVHAQGCWVDVFELTRHRGRRRRLFGPARFHSLRGRPPASGVSIDSLIVGPAAYLRLFRSDPASQPGTALWLMPGRVVRTFAELKIDDQVDSLEIHPRPPEAGEAGYAQYLRASENKQVPG